ncbi:hypothetical protein D041_3937A, partial [Vibrio parahaemolyticus EKP-008]
MTNTRLVVNVVSA